MFLLDSLAVIAPISHIRLQNGHLLLIASILRGQFLHELIDEGVLPADDLIHGHADLIEPFIEVILIGLELIYLRPDLVILVVDHHEVLLNFAHHVVHGLLLPAQLQQLLCACLLLCL